MPSKTSSKYLNKDNNVKLVTEKDIHDQVERLATFEYLIAGATHEINNALSAVIPNLKLIDSHFGKVVGIIDQYKQLSKLKTLEEYNIALTELVNEKDERINTCISKIEKYISINLDILNNVQRISQSMSHLKFLSNDTSEKFFVNESVQKVITLLEHQFEKKKIDLKIDLSSKDSFLTGSPGEFTQAILNLLINAIHAVCKKKLEQSDFLPQISIKTILEDDNVSILVLDNGPGMEPSVKNRIFNPFFTTKSDGSGLGLSIVKRIVNNLKGHIEFESEVGLFTSFILTFPLKTGD